MRSLALNIMRLFGLGLFLLLTTPSFAQSDTTAQTSDSLKLNITLDLGLDGRRTFLADKVVKMGGLKLGIQFNNILRMGLSLHSWTKTPYTVTFNPGTSQEYEQKVQTTFGYYSAYYEYIIYHSERWELSAPLQIGAGRGKFEFEDPQGDMQVPLQEPVMVLVGSLHGYHMLFTWFGVGAGVGYRKIFSQEPEMVNVYQGPFVRLHMRFELKPIYNMIFRPGKAQDTKGCMGCYGCYGIF